MGIESQDEYWIEARAWAKANAQTFTPKKVWPSVVTGILLGVANYTLRDGAALRKLLESSAFTVLAAILAYWSVYLFDRWVIQLLIKAPRALYSEQGAELVELAKELGQAKRLPADEAFRHKTVARLIQDGLGSPEGKFLIWLASTGTCAPDKFGLSGIPKEVCWEAVTKAESYSIVKRDIAMGFPTVGIKPEFRTAVATVLGEQFGD